MDMHINYKSNVTFNFKTIKSITEVSPYYKYLISNFMKANSKHNSKRNSLYTKVILTLLFILTVSFGFTQNLNINPTPQEVVITDYMDVPLQFNLQQQHTDKATQELLSSFFKNSNTDKQGFSITVGDINARFAKKLIKKVPQKSEGYHIEFTPKKISVIGRDARGTYYGVQTLIALLMAPKLPVGIISDYPDVAARGVVEGFYGVPWSFEHRIRQIDFYGLHKLNTYIYGPKDDPYHSSPNWRKPYPANEAVQIKKLIDRAATNHVDFVWAIHPGKDIKWNDEDRAALVHKFELMYELGVRAYAVFFDDISGEGADPGQQAELLNYLSKEFVMQKKDVKPLILCPTEYNKSWSNIEGGYLGTLGKELDPSIRIMWTGNAVVSDIDKETMNWINSQIQRKAFIWWNFPVSDYVRNHLLMGPVYGNSKDIADDVSGFVSNPMENAEASKIAIYGVADYTWNMSDYQPEKNWINALKEVMPESYEALEVFARHNSDLGSNTHQYRREESVDFAPEANAFLKNLQAGKKVENFDAIQKEFQAMVEASYILNNSTDNPVLMKEISWWVEQFKLMGQSGLAMLNMYRSLQTKQAKDFERSYHAVKAINAEIYAIDHNKNQNSQQAGIKTSTLVVAPLVENSLEYLIKSYNKEFGGDLAIDSHYNPHKLYTNIVQLDNQQVRLQDRTLVLNPPLEVIRFAPQAYMGFELEEGTHADGMTYQFSPATVYKNLSVEVSTDGNDWTPIETEEENEVVKATINKVVKYIRIINSSEEPIDATIDHFKLEVE